MFDILSTLLKYIFITIIYYFIYLIIKMICLDIKAMDRSAKLGNYPYLKLINRRENLDFEVEEYYTIDRNLVLGRKNDNDIVINDPYLSSRHAQFKLHGNECYISDLGSTNGTYVNKKPIGRENLLLREGDIVTVGQLSFFYVGAST